MLLFLLRSSRLDQASDSRAWTWFGPQRKAFRTLQTQPWTAAGGREITWALTIDPRMVRASHETYHLPRLVSGRHQQATMPLVA